jgi:hypothetical protein
MWLSVGDVIKDKYDDLFLVLETKEIYSQELSPAYFETLILSPIGETEKVWIRVNEKYDSIWSKVELT